MDAITTNLFRPMYYSEGVSHPVDGRPASVIWCAEIFTGRTKDGKTEIQFFKCKPDTFAFQFCNNGQIVILTDSEFLKIFKINIRALVNLTCNCHGYILMQGEYWLEDPISLLKDEYEEIRQVDMKSDDEYIICFMEGDKIAHSAKFKNNHYDHKRNIQMNEKIEINSFNTKYPEYAGLQKVYWKKFD